MKRTSQTASTLETCFVLPLFTSLHLGYCGSLIQSCRVASVLVSVLYRCRLADLLQLETKGPPSRTIWMPAKAAARR